MSSRLSFPGAPVDYRQRFALPNQRGAATQGVPVDATSAAAAPVSVEASPAVALTDVPLVTP